MVPGDLVRTTEELLWHDGCGVVIPAGAVVELLWSFVMRDGLTRWAVRLESGVVVSSIPDEFLELVQ